MDRAKESLVCGSVRHSTNPPGMDREAEPDPNLAMLESLSSVRFNPKAVVLARARAAKAEADEANPTPTGKLFLLSIQAWKGRPAISRIRSMN